MHTNKFEAALTAKERMILYFGKKRCHRCGSSLRKEKCYEIADGTILSTEFVPLYIWGGDVRRCFYRFTCPKCKTDFTLTDLMKQKDVGKSDML